MYLCTYVLFLINMCKIGMLVDVERNGYNVINCLPFSNLLNNRPIDAYLDIVALLSLCLFIDNK